MPMLPQMNSNTDEWKLPQWLPFKAEIAALSASLLFGIVG